jgi:glutamyl-tRNA reductase
VKSIAMNSHSHEPITDGFVLSTCLRHELYRCDGSGSHQQQLFMVKGLTCIRRLLYVLTGLQSEIVGEKEILLQASQAIQNSREAGTLSEKSLAGLETLLTLSELVRVRSGVESDENYSTIAADLLIQHLASETDPIVAIVGGGYMAEKFFSALLKARFVNISKLVWINRTRAKLERSLADLIHLLDYHIEVLDLIDGKNALAEANAVFCALSMSPEYFGDVRCRADAFVVDVSYPPVFKEHPNQRLVNISNTYFERLVQKPAQKAHVAHANREIDSILGFLRCGS